MAEIGTRYNSVDLNKAFEYITQANTLAQQTGISLLKARVDFTFGNYYLYKADYRKALFYYQQALRVYEEKQKYENVLRCLYNTGVVYSYLHKDDLAETYFNEALVISEKYGYQANSGILFSGLAYIREQKSDFKGAILYYKQALAKGRARNDSYVIALCNEDIGSVYLKLNQTALARKYLNEALSISLTLNNYQRLSSIYDNLSEVAIKENNLIEAEKLLLISGQYASKAGITQMISDNHKHLSELYAMRKEFKAAYSERLLYEAIKDSILNKETYKQVSDIQNAYILQKKNNEITLLNKNKEIAEANTQRQQLLLNIFAALILSICVLAIMLWRNTRLKQQLNQTLSTQNERLIEENVVAKYEVLKSRVDPHFLFNSLSTLSSIVHTDKHKAIEFIEHFSTLYRNILETIDVSAVKLKDEMAIINNYLYLQKVRFGTKLHIHFEVEHPEEYYIPTFALQMILENAIKHNIISSNKNLTIIVKLSGNTLIIENNLQRRSPGIVSTGIGQKNLLERYRLFGKELPTFIETENHYTVTLPLFNTQPKML